MFREGAEFIADANPAIRLVAIDLDGTLLTKKLELTSENAAAIRKAQQAGIHVVIATGRPASWARRKLAEAQLTCPIIGTGGAETVLADGTVASSVPIGLSLYAEIRAVLQRDRLYEELYTNSGVYTMQPESAIALRATAIHHDQPGLSDTEVQREAARRFSLSGIVPIQDYAELLSRPNESIFKLLICSVDRQSLDRIRSALFNIPGISVSSSAADNLEITQIEAQKGIALERFGASLGIPLADMAAIGDNHNDLQMLQRVGMPIAMENAEADIKRVCRFITRSNESSGVAYAIERYILR